MGGFGANFGTNFAGAAAIVLSPPTKTVTEELCVNTSIKNDLCLIESTKNNLCITESIKEDLCV